MLLSHRHRDTPAHITLSPFARIVLGICFSYTGKYLHNGEAPPFPEWPSWIDLGLVMGWAVNQLCGSGGGPQTPHHHRDESLIAQ